MCSTSTRQHHLFASAAAVVTMCAACIQARDAEPVQSSALAVTRCAGPATLEGIDVSYWQGDIDWTRVAGAGLSFAIARVGDGYYEDPTFDGHWTAMRDIGLVRGAYQFFRPSRDAIRQADIMLSHIGTLEPGDLPPVIDVEGTPGEPLPDEDVVAAQVRAWIDRIQMATGRTPMIYTGGYFWDANVGSEDFAGNPLWVAHWGTDCPRMPDGWTTWSVHQYSNVGSISGIDGDVDLDRFDGTLEDLAELAGGRACTAHCNGDDIIGGDCVRADCAASRASCVDDAVGVRCVSLYCPLTGLADVCASGTTLAHCEDGMLSYSRDCAEEAATCVSDAGSARCEGDVRDAGTDTDARTATDRDAAGRLGVSVFGPEDRTASSGRAAMHGGCTIHKRQEHSPPSTVAVLLGLLTVWSYALARSRPSKARACGGNQP